MTSCAGYIGWAVLHMHCQCECMCYHGLVVTDKLGEGFSGHPLDV